LAASLLHLGLGALCVFASLQLYRSDAINLARQNYLKVWQMQRVQENAPTLSEAQLRLIYFDLVPGAKETGRTPAIDVMRSALMEIAGHQSREIPLNSDLARAQLVRQFVIAGSKYAAIALLGTVWFFLIWDQTPRLRTVKIFAPSSDPNLVLASLSLIHI